MDENIIIKKEKEILSIINTIYSSLIIAPDQTERFLLFQSISTLKYKTVLLIAVAIVLKSNYVVSRDFLFSLSLLFLLTFKSIIIICVTEIFQAQIRCFCMQLKS